MKFAVKPITRNNNAFPDILTRPDDGGRRRRMKILVTTIGSSLVLCLVAVATPGVGFLFNNFVRGTVVAEDFHGHARTDLHERARAKDWRAELNVEGATDFVQQDVALAPGGFSGWHSHPGPVLIVVKSGTASWYSATNENCEATIYPTGSAFIEPANASHYVSNAGANDLELLTTYLIPKGAVTRQEQPQPSQCPF
jgi:quercetin dioxygenase-like cupin family protein